MAKKEQPSTTKKIRLHRKIIFLVLYFLILPIGVVTAVYVTQYVRHRPVLFENSDARFVSSNALEMFELDFIAREIRFPEFDEEGEISKNGTYQWRINLSKRDGVVGEVSNVTVQYEFGCQWTSCQKADNPRSINTLGTAVLHTVTYNEVFPITVLPFVTIDAPNIYLKITWDETIHTITTPKEAYVFFTPDEYITDETIFRNN